MSTLHYGCFTGHKAHLICLNFSTLTTQWWPRAWPCMCTSTHVWSESVWTRIYANAHLPGHRRTTHVTEVRPLASSSQSNSHYLFFYFFNSLVISPAKCPSLKSARISGHNPGPLSLRFLPVLRGQDVIAQKHLFGQMGVDLLKGRISREITSSYLQQERFW